MRDLLGPDSVMRVGRVDLNKVQVGARHPTSDNLASCGATLRVASQHRHPSPLRRELDRRLQTDPGGATEHDNAAFRDRLGAHGASRSRESRTGSVGIASPWFR